MFKKIILCLLYSSLCLIGFEKSLQADDGQWAGAFLRLPVNARANGMGSAYCAIVQDPSAGWWNPAGYGFVEKFQVAGMYALMSLDRQHNFAGISWPSESGGTLGIHWQQFGVRKIDGRDGNGSHTEYFDDNEMAFGLSYGVKLSEYFSLGATGKYLHQTLQAYKAIGYGVDAGLILNIKDLVRLGAMVQNAIGTLKWDTDSKLSETLPRQYRAGISVKPPSLPVLIVLDAAKLDTRPHTPIRYYGGLEVWPMVNLLAVRGGFADGELSAGLSVSWQGEKIGVRLDYAYLQDVLDLGGTSQFSFVVEF